MGATLSSLTENSAGGGGGRPPGLGDIPESCVAGVLKYLTPPEICNLARLNRAFRAASSSDSVWNSKLPPNWQFLLQLLSTPQTQAQAQAQTQAPAPAPAPLTAKKDIFAFLTRPLPFDNGTKLVWLERNTGAVCLSISAKAMCITGIEDRRYWNLLPTEESRFRVVAYLQQIWWFEVDGQLKFRLPAGLYNLSFRVHLGRPSRRLRRRVCNFEHTHGWDLKPVRFELSTADGQQDSCECCLDGHDKDSMGGSARGCWVDYQVGKFIVSDSDSWTEIRFSMKQIDCTHSKGGLCVDSVSIIPNDCRG
ncbi:F-box protein PP2-A15 [Amborella trichopoda]|uniref:F-box protein PP2-A15 n=1 Tax=Amborella trichopoda TaxID=13333 RepID=UPI0005D300D9|nr:F-box protein PP2-A15 [Amborella trichopoda]|eukprot:XP_011625996.1 F-box protein PP2-A15 [Amborella trichopoda]